MMNSYALYDKVYNEADGYDNYGVIGPAIEGRFEFNGRSMRGFWAASGNQYVVVSYATVIATYEDGEWEIADNRWGPTTGRHIGIVRRAHA